MLRIDINLVYIIINILILYFLLKKFLIKPLDNILAQRQAKVDGMLNNASTRESEAIQLKEKYENQIAAVQTESDRMVEQAKKDVERISGEALTLLAGLSVENPYLTWLIKELIHRKK